MNKDIDVFLIVAFDDKYGIGKYGHLLYHLRQDMMHFFQKTRDSVVIMGRKTFESLPPTGLKGRHHIIVTNTLHSNINFPSEFNEEFTLVSDVETAIKEGKRIARALGLEKVGICGGAGIYKAAIPYCDTAYITRIYSERYADTFFPAYDFYQHFDPNMTGRHCTTEAGIDFDFCTYEAIRELRRDTHTNNNAMDNPNRDVA